MNGTTDSNSQMAPVIICGMHRSGTSLISKALEMSGLFTGFEKEHNNESLFFLDINQWMFEQLGASWDNTYNMNFLNESLADYFRQVIRNYISSPAAASYTGIEPDRKSAATLPLDIAWGWKDPRNTFTAEIWASIFPDAKLVHVCRNPLDVADSLRQREQQVMRDHQAQLAQTPADSLDGKMKFQQSPRLFHLTECLSLWDEYINRALKLERSFGTNSIRVRYEDFLAEPVAEMSRLARFCGLAPDKKMLDKVAAIVDKSRCYAFTENSELQSLYSGYRQKDIMKTLGYDQLCQYGCNPAA